MIAYLDCFGGISGDMSLGALVDLGMPVEWLQNELEKMPLSGFTLRSKTVYRSGVKAENVFIQQIGAQPHRHYDDICRMITSSPYSSQVKSQSIAVFNRLAEAESRIGGCKKEAVQFSADAIVGIPGAALGFEYLGIETLAASRLPVGSGLVQSQPGVLPAPAPVTLELLKGWPVYGQDDEPERVTPVGAAIVAGLAKYSPSIPEITIRAIGYGADGNDSGNAPNLMRMIIGTAVVTENEGLENDVMVVETNIDDMNPEIFGYLMERLFEDGALDVVWIPLFMKKNRPGTKIEVLCPIAKKEKIVQRILAETTSLGVRFHRVRRSTLARRLVDVQSPWGVVQAKEVTDANGEKRIIPEFDICRRIARENHLPLKRVYEFFHQKI